MWSRQSVARLSFVATVSPLPGLPGAGLLQDERRARPPARRALTDAPCPRRWCGPRDTGRLMASKRISDQPPGEHSLPLQIAEFAEEMSRPSQSRLLHMDAVLAVSNAVDARTQHDRSGVGLEEEDAHGPRAHSALAGERRAGRTAGLPSRTRDSKSEGPHRRILPGIVDPLRHSGPYAMMAAVSSRRLRGVRALEEPGLEREAGTGGSEEEGVPFHRASMAKGKSSRIDDDQGDRGSRWSGKGTHLSVFRCGNGLVSQAGAPPGASLDPAPACP